MANQKQLAILKQGVEAWNQWRQEYANIPAHLSEANLSGANLSEADLNNADLRGADLSHADLRGVDLTDAWLRNANLSEANLSNADFRGADLRGTDLRGADLRGTWLTYVDLSGAHLREVDLSGAFLGWASFGDVDLSMVKGLETVEYEGPSTVGIDTIYRSNGNIPEAFLKGAGIDDTFITYIRSLVGKAIEYYSCFISYSSKDQDFAERLHADLQSKGVRCWYAPHDMKIGDKLRSRIDESIWLHDKLLLVLSAYSTASQWVEQEVATALARERKEQRTVLFPIRLDSTIMEIESDWPFLIRNTRHIGDFTRWKDHDKYQKAFNRLLRDLKAEVEKAEGR